MANDIRIVSLWQPWATLIALGLKEYETRSFGTSYHGPLAIHATKKQPCDVWAQVEQIWQLSGQDERLTQLLDSRGTFEFPQAAIVAAAVGVSSMPMMVGEPKQSGQIREFRDGRWQYLIGAMSPLERACGDWQAGRFGWRLIGVKPMPNIPYKGGQGVRRITDESVCEVIRPILFPNSYGVLAS
jgi:activating signal cointegrator 1